MNHPPEHGASHEKDGVRGAKEVHGDGVPWKLLTPTHAKSLAVQEGSSFKISTKQE
jgi:hypothetical protein